MNDPVAPARAKTRRRTLLAGAAWSVPVIAAAAAAPQVAASGEDFTAKLEIWGVQDAGTLWVQVDLTRIGYSGSPETVTVTVIVTQVSGAAQPPELITVTVPAGYGQYGQTQVKLTGLVSGASYTASITAPSGLSGTLTAGPKTIN